MRNRPQEKETKGKGEMKKKDKEGETIEKKRKNTPRSMSVSSSAPSPTPHVATPPLQYPWGPHHGLFAHGSKHFSNLTIYLNRDITGFNHGLSGKDRL